MSMPINYKSFFQKEDDDIYDDTGDEDSPYWGSEAAGCIFVANDTGRILIAHRSNNVGYEPNTWGTWGGKIDSGESPKEAVKREVQEETGADIPSKIYPLYVYKDGNFKYHNYLVVIPFEFTPQLNWENDDSRWVEYGDWPHPLHFGMEALIKHAGGKIKRVVELIKNKSKKSLTGNPTINVDPPSKSVSIEPSNIKTEEFKHWFRNSVVRGTNGLPLVVYHGTNQPITSFSKYRRGMSTQSTSSKKAYFFTDSTEVASEYAANAGKKIRSNLAAYEKRVKVLQKRVDRLEQIAKITGNWDAYEKAMEDYENFDIGTMREDDIEGQNILPVYLNIENPFIYDFKGILPKPGEIDSIIDTAIKNGNDGAIMKNIIDPAPASNHYVVFKSTQIKSAIGNNGNFNSKSSDITKEVVGESKWKSAAAAGLVGLASMIPFSTSDINVPSKSVHNQSKMTVVGKNKLADAHLIVATLWGEARGEGERGMHAVLNVIMNRARGDFKKAKDICLDTRQFSIWNNIKNPEESTIKLIDSIKNGKLNNMDIAMYNKAIELVNQAMQGRLTDITHGATFYFNPKKANPSWAKTMVKTKTIGNHNFYKVAPKTPRQINETTTNINITKQGLVDDGIYGYEMKSAFSYLRYGYEPSRRAFYLYNIGTPNEEDKHKGYATELLKNFFEIIKKERGTLDPGPFTTSGESYVKPVIARLAKEYNIRLI